MANNSNDGEQSVEVWRIQIYRLRIAYMHLYTQYLDLDDEFAKCRQLLGERNDDD